jgi:UDPglucose 6-dehydrogenase
MLRERRVKVKATDPVAMPRARELAALKGVTFCATAYDCAKGADALALVTEWPQYKSLDWKRLAKTMRNPLLLDGRNLYDPAEARAAGFVYCGVGRPDK